MLVKDKKMKSQPWQVLPSKEKHFAHSFSFYKITLELAQLVDLFDQKCNDKILHFVGCLYICLYI